MYYKPRDEKMVMEKLKDGSFHVRLSHKDGGVVEGTGRDLDQLVEDLRDQLGQIVRGDE